MKQLRVALGVVGFVASVACGGRAIEEPDSGEPEPSQPAPPGSAPTSPVKGNSSSRPLPSQALGECQPGFDRLQNPTRPCRWLTESGVCFEDTESACACICPSKGESVCAHGFDQGPNSATLIYCL
jgi:hypothetical protein